MSKKKTNWTVVGTGLAGLTAALALARHTEHLTLIGPKPPVQTPKRNKHTADKRTTAILSPGIEFLDTLGLWEPCRAHAVPLMTMELIDGDRSYLYDAAETDRNEFGFNIPNDTLKSALLHAIDTTQNMTWLDTTVTDAAHENGVWTLRLGDRTTHHASLVFAADGRNSIMRDAAEIDTRTKQDDQTAIVAILEAEKPHHYTSVEWYRTGGPLTLVPMDGKKLAVVWCENHETATKYAGQTPHAFAQHLTAITDRRFGALTLLNTPQTWPIRAMKADTLWRNHVVLIGEAGHVLPPIGAQGFNTSLHDIRMLDALATRAKAIGLKLQDLLPEYDTARSRDIALRYHGMNTLNDLIRTMHPALRFLRGTGLRMLERVTPLRRRVMNFGMGSNSTGNNTKGNAA